MGQETKRTVRNHERGVRLKRVSVKRASTVPLIDVTQIHAMKSRLRHSCSCYDDARCPEDVSTKKKMAKFLKCVLQYLRVNGLKELE